MNALESSAISCAAPRGLPVARVPGSVPRVPASRVFLGRTARVGCANGVLRSYPTPDSRLLVSSQLGNIGARDPFPGEVESKFGDKVLGNADTEHRIALPDNIRNIMGLSQKKCEPLPPGTLPLSEAESKELLRKVVGWKLVNADGYWKVKGEWKVKSLTCGAELFRRIAEVAESESQVVDFFLEEGNKARAEIWSQPIGGLSINDFILAAKIDEINTKDLIKKDRFFWA